MKSRQAKLRWLPTVKFRMRDFPGGPVDKDYLPMQGVQVQSRLGAKIPHALWPQKNQNINNGSLVTNSVKTFFFNNVRPFLNNSG